MTFLFTFSIAAKFQDLYTMAKHGYEFFKNYTQKEQINKLNTLTLQ